MHMNKNEIPQSLFRFSSKQEKNYIHVIKGTSMTFSQDAWHRLRKNKVAILSFTLLFTILVLSFLAPVIAPHDPNKQNIPHANLPPRIPKVSINGLNGYAKLQNKWIDKYGLVNVGEDINYIFGTDEFGRDLLSRTLYGTRISLMIAFIAATLDLTIGVSYGLFSGMKGKRVDTFMQRILEILAGIPNLVLVVLMLLIFSPGILSIVFALAISTWIPMARIVRGQTLRIKSMEYVQAAKVLGASSLRVAFLHILPNMAGIIVVRTMFSIPSAIFFETFLSFIGVGMKIPNASLGTLLNSGYKVFRIHSYQMWIPSILLCIIMLAFNLLADGLRDALDPKMKD